MCDSSEDPHLLISSKIGKCNCDHALSRCVTVPGDSESISAGDVFVILPDSSSSSFSCHSRWEKSRSAAAAGCSRKLWYGGMLAGQKKKPPHCSAEPILSKLTLWVTGISVIREAKRRSAPVSAAVYDQECLPSLYMFLLLVVEPTVSQGTRKGLTGRT